MLERRVGQAVPLVTRKRGEGGGYFRVKLPGVPDVPEVVVFTTAPIGTPLDTEAAVEMAAKMIALSPAQKRAVSSSRSWPLPKNERTHQWKRVCSVDADLERAQAIVSEFSLIPRLPFNLGDDVVAFEFRLGSDMEEGTKMYEVFVGMLTNGTEPHTVLEPVRKELVRA